MYLLNKSFIILLTLLITSCAGIKMLTDKDIYSEVFLKKMDSIQIIFRDGDKANALRRLNSMDDLQLSDSEKARKYNFIGIISFSQADYEFASKRFREAKTYVREDNRLRAQIYLNLASSLYKLGEADEPYKLLSQIEKEFLANAEKSKFHKLNLVLSVRNENYKQVLTSLVYLMKDNQTFSDVESSEYKNLLTDNFRKLSASQKIYFLEDYESSNNVNIAYLASLEATSRFYLGEKEEANSMLSWMASHFDRSEDVERFVTDFKSRIENYSKIDMNSIGVILPLSEEKEKFGYKALAGLETALNKSSMNNLNLIVRDNKNNSVLAKNQVRSLIQNKHVSAIIGGLYAQTAKDEYLEAKKYGVLFISLSPVYINAEEKNHLLIEVTGSIQSQIATIFNKKFTSKYGNRVAVLYPESEGGDAYINEVWRKSKEENIELKSLYSYGPDTSDYRQWVKKILGLEFTRERKEEYLVWEKIHLLEKKKTTIRRIQTLKPVIDFDWVFIPAYAKEAIQILPTFKYYDAKNIQFVGVPEWMSRKIVKEQRHLGNIMLVGNSPEDINKEVTTSFYDRNKRRAGLIEAISYDAFNIIAGLQSDTAPLDRSDLANKLKQKAYLKGLTGEWKLNDNLWIKDMDMLSIRGKKIIKVDLEETSN